MNGRGRISHIENREDLKEIRGNSRSLADRSVRAKGGSVCVRSGMKNQVSSIDGPRHSFKQYSPSHTSFRQVQVKMETENQQVQELLQPLFKSEEGFMKELECFLKQTEINELRRKEHLHKRWTECVWFPLQKRVEERVSRFNHVEAKRHQNTCSQRLQNCNSKFKTTELKEMFNLQLHERTGKKGDENVLSSNSGI